MEARRLHYKPRSRRSQDESGIAGQFSRRTAQAKYWSKIQREVEKVVARVAALRVSLLLTDWSFILYWSLTALEAFIDNHIAELTAGPELGPPPHIHRHSDECFYILEGLFDFSLAGRAFTAGAGALYTSSPALTATFKKFSGGARGHAQRGL